MASLRCHGGRTLSCTPLHRRRQLGISLKDQLSVYLFGFNCSDKKSHFYPSHTQPYSANQEGQFFSDFRFRSKMLKEIFSVKKTLVLIDRFGVFLLLAMVVIAFVAAVIEATPVKSLGSALIDTFTSDAKDAEGYAKIMHVLLTLVVGWAAIKIYIATAGYKWDALIARYFARQHIVIMAGRSAESKTTNSQSSTISEVADFADQTALAIDIAITIAAEQKVVLNIPNLHSSRLTKLWSAGVRVLKDDMELPDLLEATGVNRAKTLIAMRDLYTENIALTRTALSTKSIPAQLPPQLDSYRSINRFSQKYRNYLKEKLPKYEKYFSLPEVSPLECKCMIEPLSVKQNFKLEDYLEDDMLARVRVFNESELIARRMIRDYPPDASVAQTNQRVHVLLIGLGSVGQAIAIQLARMGHYKSNLRPKITIVDRHVKDRWQQVVKIHPTLPAWLADVEPIESHIEDVQEKNAKKWLKDEYPITMVYVCTKNELANLRITRLLLRLLEQDEHKILARKLQVVALDPPGGCVLGEFSKRTDNKDRFKLFSLMKVQGQGAASPLATNLLTETDDEIAKALHKDYCDGEDEKLANDPTYKRKPAHKPWEKVAETYREANRSSADHVQVKLRAVGRILVPSSEGSEVPLSEEEIELLARMEHERWWAERSLDGWKFATNRNDLLKEHPDMVPYDQLNEQTKGYDRKNVNKIIEILKGEDKIIVMGSVSNKAL